MPTLGPGIIWQRVQKRSFVVPRKGKHLAQTHYAPPISRLSGITTRRYLLPSGQMDLGENAKKRRRTTGNRATSDEEQDGTLSDDEMDHSRERCVACSINLFCKKTYDGRGTRCCFKLRLKPAPRRTIRSGTPPTWAPRAASSVGSRSAIKIFDF